MITKHHMEGQVDTPCLIRQIERSIPQMMMSGESAGQKIREADARDRTSALIPMQILCGAHLFLLEHTYLVFQGKKFLTGKHAIGKNGWIGPALC